MIITCFELNTSSSFWLSVFFTSGCNCWLYKFLSCFFLQHFIYFRDSWWYHFLRSLCLCFGFCLSVHFWFCLNQLFIIFVESWSVISMSCPPIFQIFFVLFNFWIFSSRRFSFNFCLSCCLTFLFSIGFRSNLYILLIFIAPSRSIISMTWCPVIQVFFILFFLWLRCSWRLSTSLYSWLYFIFNCLFCLNIFLIFIAPCWSIISMTRGPIV